MANPEHVAILKQGVEVWNRWRRDNLRVEPDLSRAVLSGSDLSGASLHSTNLSNANLSQSVLAHANLVMANLYGADLTESALVLAQLVYATLNGAMLKGANLTGANLTSANLTNAVLWGVRTNGANFNQAHLQGADFRNAEVGWTVFADVDLSSCLGLDAVTHRGPSSIGIETLLKSGGAIPDEFLRGVGAPEAFLTYSRSLVGQPLRFYSCFISYSTKDQEFADQLWADLQANGVRCWLATEDLRIGDPFRQSIDEAVRLHDKLLLILSANSVGSAWVQDEVEAALERERREKRLVLFPIRVDDAVMETEQAWAASIRRTRHVGDFSKWKDHDSYQKTFERLLRDLNAQGADTK
jgi:hypothetical protein